MYSNSQRPGFILFITFSIHRTSTRPTIRVYEVWWITYALNNTFFILYKRYYSATIIRMSGVKGDETAIWLSAVTSLVNFLFTILGLYLVEKIGRRALTLGSLIGKRLQILCICCVRHCLALLCVSWNTISIENWKQKSNSRKMILAVAATLSSIIQIYD